MEYPISLYIGMIDKILFHPLSTETKEGSGTLNCTSNNALHHSNRVCPEDLSILVYFLYFYIMLLREEMEQNPTSYPIRIYQHIPLLLFLFTESMKYRRLTDEIRYIVKP